MQAGNVIASKSLMELFAISSVRVSCKYFMLQSEPINSFLP
jgi:hypothetical protein